MTDANDILVPVHDRIPVILLAYGYDAWLGGEADDEFLKPYASEDLEAYPAGRKFNSPGNDDPSMIERIEAS